MDYHRTIKRVRQKLSLALVDLDEALSEQATVVLTELETHALYFQVQIEADDLKGKYCTDINQLRELDEAIISAELKTFRPECRIKDYVIGLVKRFQHVHNFNGYYDTILRIHDYSTEAMLDELRRRGITVLAPNSTLEDSFTDQGRDQ